MFYLFVVLILTYLLPQLTATRPYNAAPVIHLPLTRRGNRFSRREPANLTYLADILQAVEAKYASSYREIEGNRLVRRWRVKENDDENDPHLIDVAGHLNRWCVGSRQCTDGCDLIHATGTLISKWVSLRRLWKSSSTC